ncbi:hypothetical protein DFH09DRAFT_1144400 [Mycena vulgaris]|nr:hypothetical protein DFH09DRAFT_1144400 [Mycena vulgaris]
MASTVFETAWSFAVQDVLKTAIALFLNGFYVLLVILAIYFLRRRTPTGYRVHICTLAVMLILATAQMALQIVTATLSMKSLHSAVQDDGPIYSGQQVSLQHMSLILGFLELILLVTNNIVIDGLLIYRCYVIWGTSHYKKKVVVLPLLLLLSTTVVGCITAYRNGLGPPEAHSDTRIVFGLVLIANLLSAGLTVGRIWWTRRHLQAIGQTKLIRRYNIAMAMLLESSALYFICLVILLVVLSFNNPSGTGSPVAYVSYGFGGQLANIIPALIIVQVSFWRKGGGEVAATQEKLLPA